MLSAEGIRCIEEDGERLLERGRTDPERPVPQYPGWSMRDLLSHTASIHGRTTLVCELLPEDRVSAPRLPDGADVLDWYEENLAAMVVALTEADPDTPVWSFASDGRLAFWERRMVVETGVHRWDADHAFGEDDPLMDYVARCGLDEFEEMWFGHLGKVSTLRFDAVDQGESWVFGPGEPKESVVGTASDIYLRLMARQGVPLPPDWTAAVDGLSPAPKR